MQMLERLYAALMSNLGRYGQAILYRGILEANVIVVFSRSSRTSSTKPSR